ncbi:rhodanese-like domain-containing protein [Vagococcus carniphilus]|uniref:rhodanese-like domain-containing protein n=1 Tax=Vagococcus carniphilus TaxID=218144 RepID=UPI00288F4CA7|nr:rhodanese-like domain-containing protein [Vagococcus carniphilus]MDT2814390.1 rhodanese-like domain-containing protein [Vagococcus carniphilus]MDT2829444.1 rhodanese-like domain-containing protein [Vagococcus carniphilus]MDT2838903.1 rhodanese-like domain-containing protein [Vagococcus carniphilus]MDT2852961.1 rhodanese-like domain-containing protein [Vagococcus carniphilus]MDT2864511.1 rhodanese-like domain-containing protein [Vagococcus carniphilus]
MSFLATINVILFSFIIIYGLYKLYFFIMRKRTAKMLTQEEFQESMRSAQVIDVREKEDFNRGHILGARSVPYTISKAHKEYLTAIRKDKPIYLYDNKVAMAIYMAKLLKKEGFTDIYILKDGYSGWTGKTKKK